MSFLAERVISRYARNLVFMAQIALFVISTDTKSGFHGSIFLKFKFKFPPFKGIKGIVGMRHDKNFFKCLVYWRYSFSSG
ncbi:MAG: hypothetical protein DRR19_11575 [Candidatus Parabeggiatoa sp. nov. 1]|nr:MAG: hypothetical protein DRR19_11575 [Gammaproteobacteria bacterium]